MAILGMVEEEPITLETIESKYFRYDERCRKHNYFSCNKCTDRMDQQKRKLQETQEQAERRERMKNEPPKAIALVPLDVNDDNESACQKARSIESFSRQVEMIKTVFGYTDQDIDKIKIVDLQKLVAKAQKEATIGHMNQLIKKPSFLERLRCKIG